MSTERLLTIPVSEGQLGRFLVSLLGQPRTIERRFEIPNLFASYDKIINLVTLLDQRILSQNIAELTSFKCSYYFESGRIVSLSERESFLTFNDTSQEESVGIDFTASYLVNFPDSDIPKKQDIRIEIFSDAGPRDFPRGFDGKSLGKPQPLLKYTIHTTNLTWGEDVAHHLNNTLKSMCTFDALFRCYRLLTNLPEMSVPFFIAIAFVAGLTVTASIFVPLGDQSDFSQLAGLDLINAKLDLLVRASPFSPKQANHSLLGSHRFLEFLFSAIVLLCCWKILLKFGATRIVALNAITNHKIEKAIKSRELVQWALFGALAIGIVAGLLSARLDAFIFR